MIWYTTVLYCCNGTGRLGIMLYVATSVHHGVTSHCYIQPIILHGLMVLQVTATYRKNGDRHVMNNTTGIRINFNTPLPSPVVGLVNLTVVLATVILSLIIKLRLQTVQNTDVLLPG